jgi:hypothetical protein
VRVEKAGVFPLRVESSTGVTQKKTITIDLPDKNAGKFVVEFSGPIGPGKTFTVVAKVTSPVSGQKLTLTLPAGLQLVAGAPTQDVPQFASGGQGTSVVNWTVRVVEAGLLPVRVDATTGKRRIDLPVRVDSTTGIARTKTITFTDVGGGDHIFGK